MWSISISVDMTVTGPPGSLRGRGRTPPGAVGNPRHRATPLGARPQHLRGGGTLCVGEARCAYYLARSAGRGRTGRIPKSGRLNKEDTHG